jgi:predicted Zn-dependent peptidase
VTVKVDPVPPVAAGPLLELDRVVAHTLGNGLRVRLFPDRGAHTVSYYTFFQVGSRNERLGLTGISHLFEHMMFNGAEKYGPKQFDQVLEGRGGSSNAYTSTDLTAYYEDFAADALPVVVDLESDRMRSLRLSPETLEQERAVVKEERRLRTENSVFGLMEEQLEALVFLSHPYRWPAIGWMEDIERISLEDCRAFFRTYYAPSNAAVYAVGDLDPEATLALIERSYADIPAGPPAPPVAQGEPAQRGERRAEVRYPAREPALLVGWRGPPARSPQAKALDVLQACLAWGESSRLKRRLVQELELCSAIHVGWGWRIDPSVFLVYAEMAPGVRPERVEQVLWREVSRLASRGVAAAEVARAKRLLRSGVLHEMATHSGVAHALGQAEALLGDWREAGRSLEHYAAVTPAAVRRAAAEFLDPARRCVVRLRPEGEQ